MGLVPQHPLRDDQCRRKFKAHRVGKCYLSNLLKRHRDVSPVQDLDGNGNLQEVFRQLSTIKIEEVRKLAWPSSSYLMCFLLT